MVCFHYCELFLFTVDTSPAIGSRDDLVRQQVGVVYLSEDNNEILFTDSFNFPGDTIVET